MTRGRGETGCCRHIDEEETDEIIETGGIQRIPGQDDLVSIGIFRLGKFDFQLIGQSDRSITIEWTGDVGFRMNFTQWSNPMRILLALNSDDQRDQRQQQQQQKFRSHRRDKIFTQLIFEVFRMKFVFFIFCFVLSFSSLELNARNEASNRH